MQILSLLVDSDVGVQCVCGDGNDAYYINTGVLYLDHLWYYVLYHVNIIYNIICIVYYYTLVATRTGTLKPRCYFAYRTHHTTP